MDIQEGIQEGTQGVIQVVVPPALPEGRQIICGRRYYQCVKYLWNP